MDSELLMIAQGFALVAEGIRTLAETQIKEPKDNKKPAGKDVAGKDVAEKDKKQGKTEQEKESGKVAVEDIREVLAQKSKDGKSKEVRALLNKFGVVKLSSVEEKDYPALLLEAGAL